MDSLGDAIMNPAQDVLLQLFADYRAEWPQPYFAQLFVPPPYFQKLETNRPCLLIGGRGTGKTTALKSLRYDAAEDRLKPHESAAKALPYFGIYIRINKNRVRAFDAEELPDSTKKRAFAHYFNLLATIELCHLTVWLQQQLENSIDVSKVSETFGAEAISEARTFIQFLEHEMSRLELFVNNGGMGEAPIFSIAEAPIRCFAKILRDNGYLENKLLFCCIDEYENLSATQQAQLNTYIKHSEPPLSYKIGIRRYGLHTRATIDQRDQIATPDDYLEIDIAEESFDQFAIQVAEHRLKRAHELGAKVPTDVYQFLPELSFDAEASLLGCERVSDGVLAKTAANCNELSGWANGVSKSKLFFAAYWQEGTKEPLCDLLADWQTNTGEWETRLNNYGYASLFWLSKGRKGARIRKYYCGVRTLLALASGNIRYFLELIDVAINVHFEQAGNDTDSQYIVISPKAQTEAAKAVGKRRLEQLEGLSERGVELKRLVLAIGKVLFELARDPVGRAPEQNLFVLTGSPRAQEQATTILREGVAHLAFEATPRTKATTPAEMRDDEYRLHPIFSAFFEFSHRKKRRITLSADSLLKLASQPAQAIAEMLDKRAQTETEDLPEQMAIFTDFFDGGSGA